MKFFAVLSVDLVLYAVAGQGNRGKLPMRGLARKGGACVLCAFTIFYCADSHAQTKIYWTNATANPNIQRSNLDGSDLETIVTVWDLVWNSAAPWIEGLAIDPEEGKIYWAGNYLPNGRIQRANLDGSNQEVLAETGLQGPGDVMLDLENRKLYWVDAGEIYRSDLDGTNIENPIGSLALTLALDPVRGKLYWTGVGLNIMRSDLDGGNIEAIVALSSRFKSPLAIDPSGRKIYWIDGGDVIRRANLNGTNIEAIGTAASSSVDLALNFSENKLYWGDVFGSNIRRSNFDGTDVEIVPVVSAAALGIAFDAPTRGVSLPAANRPMQFVLVLSIVILGLRVLAAASRTAEPAKRKS